MFFIFRYRYFPNQISEVGILRSCPHFLLLKLGQLDFKKNLHSTLGFKIKILVFFWLNIFFFKSLPTITIIYNNFCTYIFDLFHDVFSVYFSRTTLIMCLLQYSVHIILADVLRLLSIQFTKRL